MRHSEKKENRPGARMSGRLHQIWIRLQYGYRSFLVHFMLSASMCAVLFLLLFRLQGALNGNTVSRYLRCDIFDLRPRTESVSVPTQVLSYTFYHADLSTVIDTAGGWLHEIKPQQVPSQNEGDRVMIPGAGPHVYDPESAENRYGTEDLPSPPLSGERDWILQEDGGDLYTYDPSLVDSDRYALIPMDLSGEASLRNEKNGGILLSNQTAYSPDILSMLEADYPISAAKSVFSPSEQPENDTKMPLVLIVHTHGTEAYAPDGAISVKEDFSARSENIEENVVSVGAVLAKTLRSAGVPVIHCTEMFDFVSYADAYTKSAAYIQKMVAQYPSIQYVFDVHRDALTTGNGDMIRPVTQINGEVCAQIMSVVGTNEAGAYHPHWRENLTVAVQLQKRLNDVFPSFARPINLRSATFNAQYAKGSLLLEIGAAGNSVQEARSAAYYLGETLAEMILEN